MAWIFQVCFVVDKEKVWKYVTPACRCIPNDPWSEAKPAYLYRISIWYKVRQWENIWIENCSQALPKNIRRSENVNPVLKPAMWGLCQYIFKTDKGPKGGSAVRSLLGSRRSMRMCRMYCQTGLQMEAWLQRIWESSLCRGCMAGLSGSGNQFPNQTEQVFWGVSSRESNTSLIH